jgi:DNA-binding SARP family transcriptional activator/tetratricopeptide (TPR) repeat protein
MPKLEMVLLGQPRFKLNGRSITNEIARKGQALIAYLAVTKQTHSREMLAGLLWSEMPESNARRNLRVALTKLRPLFDGHLVIQRRTLTFDLESDYWLDVDLFESCLSPAEPTVQQLQTAVDLYRGPFLADLPLRDAPAFDDWIRPYQERLRQLAMDALYRLAVHYTQHKQYSKGIDFLGRLLTLEPWLEEAHRQLMRLYVLSGQRSAALVQYELCRDMLAEELGVEPAEDTVTLYQQILQDEIEEDSTTTDIIPVVDSVAKWLPPFQAPTPTRHFVGREALQAEIIEALAAPGDPAIQAIVGMGGMGKSTLAAQIAQSVQSHFADGVLWANVATGEPMTILENWAQLYGYDFAGISDLKTMATAFRGVLANKEILIVLDDVTSVSRIRPLLPENKTIPVLLTTRDQDLAAALQARLWSLRELEPENGRLLLTHILGHERIEAEPEAAAAICRQLHNLPLAIEIMAQRLKSRSRRRLDDVATRLRDETRRLSELRVSDREVRASFALSYASLDAELRHIFTLMGLFGGRPFTANALAAIAEQDRYEVEDRIFALAALSLVREEGEARYSQHPLLADFAREKLGQAAADYKRLAAYYLDFSRQYQDDYDTLRPEWENIMAAMHIAYDHHLWPTVIAFARVLEEAWFTRGRYAQAREGYNLATKAAVQTADTVQQAYFLQQWGQACIEQKDYTAAHDLLRQSQQCYGEIDDLQGKASTETILARLALEQGDFDDARAYLSRSRRLREDLNDIPGMAEIHHMEARLHFFQGEFDQAAALGQEALALWEETADQHRLVRTLNLVAAIAFEQKLPELAEQYSQRSLTLCETLQDKGEQAMVLIVLANIYRQRQNFSQAQAAIERSLSLLETTGDLGSQANALYELSRIHLENGQYEEAIQFGRRSLQLCRTVPSQLLQVYVLNYLGDAYQKLAQTEKARKKWKKALAIARALPHSKAIRDTERRLDRL